MNDATYQLLLSQVHSMPQPPDPNPEETGVRTLPGVFREGEQISIAPTPRNPNNFMHRHEDIEICYLYQGHVQMQTETQTFSMEVGDFLMLDTNCTHSPVVLDDETLLLSITIRRTFFDDAFFRHFCQADAVTSFFAAAVCSGKTTKRFLYFRASSHPGIRQVIERMTEEYYLDTLCSRELVSSYLMILFAEIIRAHAASPSLLQLQESSCDMPQLGNIISYINAHLSDVTRTDVADEFGYSYSYITKIIQAATGSGFTQLRQTLRIQNAEKLLRDTRLPVSQIAELSGFSGASEFYRAFRKHCAMTPQEYRSLHQS